MYLSDSFVHLRPLSVHNADLSLLGDHQFERFGASVEIVPCVNGDGCMLLVGSPGAHCTLCDHFSPAGKLSGFSIQFSTNTNASISASKSFVLEGNVKKAKFGSAIAVGNPYRYSDGSKVLAVSSVSGASGSGLFGNLTYGMIVLVNLTSLNGVNRFVNLEA